MFEQRCKTSTALTPGKMPPFLFVPLLIFIIIVSFAKLCSISSWQYEMQLKRWKIRKNATRSEWQQYFAANKDQPIANSLGDRPGINLAPVILSKSTVSKKRASRWVSGSIVAPSSVPAHAILAPRVSDSTSLGNEEHTHGVLSLNDPIIAQGNTQLGFQHASQDTVDSLHATENFPLLNEPCWIDNFSTHSVLGSPSQLCADVLRTPAHSLDFGLTLSVVPGLQSPVYEVGNSDLADFPVIGLSAGNNTAIFMLQDIRQKLPFAQLEQSIVSRGIVLERSAGHTMFSGFAPRVVAGFLSSKSLSMVRQASGLERSLRMLGAQIPGENSALITDDQVFETRFARLLLFSMLNGFAGLDGIPMKNVLRFLNQFVVNKLFLDVLEQSPRYVSRTLADNIFRAAIEAKDTEVVKLLLNRRLVDVNETVCFHNTERYTPIERASALRSLNLMRSLIDAGADVNKSRGSFSGGTRCGAFDALNLVDKPVSQIYQRPMSSELVEVVKLLYSAGARVDLNTMLSHNRRKECSCPFLDLRNARPENHRDYVQDHCSFIGLRKCFEVSRDPRSFHYLISLCYQADCNKCLAWIVTQFAYNEKVGLIKLLFQDPHMKFNLSDVFLAAIRSRVPALIDFILSLGPDLDPPANNKICQTTTPIAEAVSHGNEHLIRILEAKGCLDHLNEGGRFQAVIAAAAETGDAAYMRKLLAHAVTSKEAYRVELKFVHLTTGGSYPDILQMLLEAGTDASSLSIRLPGTSIEEDMQILHALITSGAGILGEFGIIEKHDLSIVTVLFNEFPDFQLDDSDLPELLLKCIDTDKLDFFRAVLQNMDLQIRSLDDCLFVAVALGHSSLVEYLLDMGARPFDDSVLQAAISEKPDMLRLLLQKERRRQTMPKCIGARVLVPVMGNGAGNAEALDELTRTGAINFVRLEVLYDKETTPGLRAEYYGSIRFTPLGMAIQGVPDRFDSSMVAVKKFLEAGADPNGISKSNKYWTKGSPLMTALMVAVETGLEDAVNMLLDYGAEVNARPRIRTTRTALQFATELGNMDMVQLLLSRGADVNSSASSRGGATALQFAAMTGNCNMVAYLLDHGAQLDAKPSRIDGMWPLEGAAANGRLDMVRFLWELNVRAVAGGTFPDGFLERHCLRAMNFARKNEHIGCMYLVSDLSGISLDRLETDEYGAPWIAY